MHLEADRSIKKRPVLASSFVKKLNRTVHVQPRRIKRIQFIDDDVFRSSEQLASHRGRFPNRHIWVLVDSRDITFWRPRSDLDDETTKKR